VLLQKCHIVVKRFVLGRRRHRCHRMRPTQYQNEATKVSHRTRLQLKKREVSIVPRD
jgi:hypothetical protein